MMLGRELKRVPMDFDYPLHCVWLGYTVGYDDDRIEQNNGRHTVPDKWVEFFDEKVRSIEPPIGEGFQCWETVSEGSPCSPVFKTLEELCDWLVSNPSGITNKMTKQNWLDALNDGYGLIDIHTGEMVNK